MDRLQAETLYDSGKEPTVAKLLEIDEENRALKGELESVRRNSTNSSKPPSSDGPEVERKKRPAGGRKPGAQPGHAGKSRELLPIEDMDDVQDLYPTQCEKCSRALDPHVDKETSEPFRHQVFEVPEAKPHKTEFRSHEIECTCGHRTRAPLPPQVAVSSFGPRAHALIAYLTSCQFGTRRGVCEIMSTLFGIEISLGALCRILERVNDALETPVTQIRKTLSEAKNLNVDETGWKSAGCRRTLWVFVSPLAAYFCIAKSRGAAVLSLVLGAAFSGIITSDDHSAYSAYHKNGLRQLCWAHGPAPA